MKVIVHHRAERVLASLRMELPWPRMHADAPRMHADAPRALRLVYMSIPKAPGEAAKLQRFKAKPITVRKRS